jgi:hypothetical protein
LMRYKKIDAFFNRVIEIITNRLGTLLLCAGTQCKNACDGEGFKHSVWAQGMSFDNHLAFFQSLGDDG